MAAMNFPAIPVVALGESALSLRDWLLWLKRQRRLAPLLRAAVLDQLLLHLAEEAGLSVSDAELQNAADATRRQLGLTSAAQTHAWLKREGLSPNDFETSLEHDLLGEKLRDHVTGARIADHFAANQTDYARARLRLILVSREDLARELLAQMREEGRDFADLARQHSLHESRDRGGLLGLVRRRQLAPHVAEAVFTTAAGEIAGPLAAPQGFQLLLVEEVVPPQLDAELTALIRQEVFDAWLAARVSERRLELPLLEAI